MKKILSIILSILILLPSSVDMVFILIGSSVGELIAKGLDYLDPKWKRGFAKNNGYILN